MAFNAAAALEAEVFAATYVVEIHGVSYTLPVRYQEPVLIGGGTFGQVIGAVDTMTGESVAVKKLTRWNHSVDDCKRAFVAPFSPFPLASCGWARSCSIL
eukprot:m.463163 g.463163  ORF g.463163 m.463163 type:complete len:100 (-) comp57030_c0_seq6:1138-1437(-)